MIRDVPAKAVNAGCLLFRADRSFLVVHHPYSGTWGLPGGHAEHDESPAETCRRETNEELGIEIAIERLLAIDHRRANERRNEYLRFLFAAVPENERDLDALRPDRAEVDDVRFVQLDQASALLTPSLADIVLAGLTSDVPAYLEEGQPAVRTERRDGAT